jgi:hypothetical protein
MPYVHSEVIEDSHSSSIQRPAEAKLAESLIQSATFYVSPVQEKERLL